MICFFSGVFAWAVWYFAWLKEPDLFFVCSVCLGERFGIFLITKDRIILFCFWCVWVDGLVFFEVKKVRVILFFFSVVCLCGRFGIFS